MKFDFLARIEGQFKAVAPGFDNRRISAIFNQAQDEVLFHKYNPNGNKYGTGFEYDEKRRRDLAELVTTVYLNAEDVSGTTTYTGDTTSGSNRIQALSDTDGLAEGLSISGTNIPAGAIIVAFESDTVIRISEPAIASASGVTLTSGIGKSDSQKDAHIGAGIKGTIFDLPPSFLYSTQEGCKTTEDNTTWGKILPITHDYFNANAENTYKQPYKDLIWRLDLGRKIKGFGLQDGTEGNDAPSPKRIELVSNGSDITDVFIRYLKYPRRIVVDTQTPANQISCELDESTHSEIVATAVRIATATMRPEEYQIKQNESNLSE